MFTGIVRALGRVSRRDPYQLIVTTAGLAREGESLAVNGACLTVTRVLNGEVALDLSEETLARTALSDLRPRDPVNLEPALGAGEGLGGHFVLGHVDTVGKISELLPRKEGMVLGVAFDPRFGELLVDRGSVAVDGISLTPFDVREGSFRCAIVPYTLEHTNLRFRHAGDRVNLEFDILAKCVRRWRER